MSTTYNKAGFIYLLKGDDYYKIGISNNPEKRRRELSLGLPFKLKVLHKFKTDDMVSVEFYLHSKYATYHSNGEWYKLPETAVRWLLSLEEFNYEDAEKDEKGMSNSLRLQSDRDWKFSKTFDQ